jgi:hypothetical protein
MAGHDGQQPIRRLPQARRGVASTGLVRAVVTTECREAGSTQEAWMVTSAARGSPTPISFDEVGDPAGFPVLFHHGAPCSRLLPDWWDPLAKARGLRIVCFDRPGYGDSPAQPGRTVLDVVAATSRARGRARDRAVRVLGRLQWCSVRGRLCGDARRAGGGRRRRRGGAPNDGSPDWLPEWARESSTEEIERHFWPALAGRRSVVADALQQSAAELRAFDVPGWLEAWSDVFSPADKRALDGQTAAYLLGNIQEALRPGIDGWVDDEIAFAQPWRVDLADVRQPAAIWHGDEDRIVAPATRDCWPPGSRAPRSSWSKARDTHHSSSGRWSRRSTGSHSMSGPRRQVAPLRARLPRSDGALTRSPSACSRSSRRQRPSPPAVDLLPRRRVAEPRAADALALSGALAVGSLGAA